jgi:hypothetical protein
MATKRKPSTKTATARSLVLQVKALDLRRAGTSISAIGRKLQISKTHAYRLVVTAMDDTRKQIGASADELRAEELSRLDGMLAKVYPKAAKGDLPCIDRVLKIAERRARLLGLDAPTRTAIEGGGDGTPPLTVVSDARVMFYLPDNGRV